MRHARDRFARAAACLGLLVAWRRPAGAQTPADPGAAATAATVKQAPADLASVDQLDQAIPDFDKTRTPDSPAFVILGVSPTEIQRPGTPMGLATSLSGFVSGTSLAIPTNLALEVAPYWLVGHPTLTSSDYEQGGWRNAYRTFTISLATKQTARHTTDAAGMMADHADSDLALGIRARLYGSGSDHGADCTRKVQALRDAAAERAASAIFSEAEMQKLAAQFGKNTPEYLAAFQKAQQDKLQLAVERDALSKAQKELDKKCFDVTASAQGISLDVAGAADWTFPDSIATAANGDLIAGAGWFTGAYAGPSFTAAIMARYAGRQIGGDWQQVFDGGLRLVYKKDAFALSGEGILRGHLSGPGDNTYKIDVVAEYKVSGDSWVTVTFGRSFEASQAGTLFSLANLTWAFGKPKIE